MTPERLRRLIADKCSRGGVLAEIDEEIAALPGGQVPGWLVTVRGMIAGQEE